ncbi:hypothetical protein Barb6_00959 [Bacteroidales bacterium Barb6]|nr:hypothetical protein Barb6_00959 [Bacteroidales bacterium Barb6]
MQAFYTRIVEKNPQAKRKAIVACMRKLLTLIFVLWKKEEEYDENYLWGKNAGKARITVFTEWEQKYGSICIRGTFNKFYLEPIIVSERTTE